MSRESQPTGKENTTPMSTARKPSSTISCASHSAASPAAQARSTSPTCTARLRSATVSTFALAYADRAPGASAA